MWDRIFVAMIRHLLKKGDLTLRMPSGEVVHAGDGTAPKVSVELHDHFLPKKLILNPELAMGEAYMDERLTIDGDDVRITTTSRRPSITSSSTRISNTPAPISRTRPTRWKRRRLPRKSTSRANC